MPAVQIPTITETVIRRQFPYQTAALLQELPVVQATTVVITGCGTSYYLAQVIACAFNAHGQAAIAVPGAEWARRPECYLTKAEGVLVIGFFRSGTTSETVQEIETSCARGWRTLAVSCEPESTILLASQQALYIPTDTQEGIVMSVSASLMLLAGLRMAGVQLHQTIPMQAAAAMAALETGILGLLKGRSHFVYLGAGPNYGMATEGCLKLQEMSISYSQAFHPMEYRHGPVSLTDDKSLVVMLYSQATAAEEAALVAELQMLGEIVALSKGIDSEAPRHLSKVVVLQ